MRFHGLSVAAPGRQQRDFPLLSAWPGIFSVSFINFIVPIL